MISEGLRISAYFPFQINAKKKLRGIKFDSWWPLNTPLFYLGVNVKVIKCIHNGINYKAPCVDKWERIFHELFHKEFMQKASHRHYDY